jgi:hypothetical protein
MEAFERLIRLLINMPLPKLPMFGFIRAGSQLSLRLKFGGRTDYLQGGATIAGVCLDCPQASLPRGIYWTAELPPHMLLNHDGVYV